MLERLKFLLLRLMPNALRKHRLIRYYETELAGGGEEEIQKLTEFVAAGDLCLDIGCNMGAYSYALAKLGAKVIAFEPNPVMAGMVRRLGLDNVEMREIAISNVDGTAVLNIPQVASGHALASLRADVAADGRTQRVEVVTRRLDSLDLRSVRFVKIDVEGFEEQVLDGGRAMIEREQPILLIEIEERHNQGGLSRIVASLASLGYAARFLRNDKWRDFSEFEPARDQRAGVPTSEYINNFLFLPHAGAQYRIS